MSLLPVNTVNDIFMFAVSRVIIPAVVSQIAVIQRLTIKFLLVWQCTFNLQCYFHNLFYFNLQPVTAVTGGNMSTSVAPGGIVGVIGSPASSQQVQTLRVQTPLGCSITTVITTYCSATAVGCDIVCYVTTHPTIVKRCSVVDCRLIVSQWWVLTKVLFVKFKDM